MVCSPLEITEPTFWAITGAAFADSVNPCAIAVLLLLITGLVVIKDKNIILKTGLAFVAGLYTTYYAIGLGLLGAVQLAGLGFILHKIVGIIAILIGLANIKDFFWYGKLGFVTEVPRSWRPTMKGLIKKVASPIMAFVIGVIVTFFELPCTGGPYLFVLGLLSKEFSWSAVLVTLLYYNLIFVLPLVLILLLIRFGYTTADQTMEWKNKNLKILHLVVGIVMVVLGVWLMFV
ncbi:hypothetical protein DRH29_00345 [candidate division Kazan bacterium]|uniref:Urease accessory protein UreH-like transmembrane domain-containing protein n=1 Tax=candidate division Kazan bacterium TaxID=2202143 RepID=A0A420ZDS9_UNCK3|nr:MAG: hypothetical protein DRH29_00345 [candidate division Kazan bacterium]